MRSVISALAASATCLALASPAAAENRRAYQTLDPSSAWQIDYSPDSCALRRAFGEGRKQVQLQIRQFSPVSSLQFTVIANGWKVTERSARFRAEPTGEWAAANNAVYADFGDDFAGIVFNATIHTAYNAASGALDPGEQDARMKAFANISGFTIEGAFVRDFTLNAGSMQAPYQAMQDCLDELLTHWGIDAKAQRSLTRYAAPKDYQSVVREVRREYPEEMERTAEPGVVRARLIIGESGDVTDCHVQVRISNPAFERTACERLSKAKFEPALDKDGKPIASYWTTTVIYGNY